MSTSPAGEHEDLVEIWLWAEQVGVFSHETALAFQDLSDALPARIHMTVPESWQDRRLRVPKGVVLYFSNVDEKDRTWIGAVPVTVPRRTLADCIGAGVQPDLIQQAIGQAVVRGIVSRNVAKALRRRLLGREHQLQ